MGLFKGIIKYPIIFLLHASVSFSFQSLAFSAYFMEAKLVHGITHLISLLKRSEAEVTIRLHKETEKDYKK
jgi:hypothetical protein